MKPDPWRRCERCGRRHVRGWVYLELDSRANTWHPPGAVRAADSQGLFPFGRACAASALKAAPGGSRPRRQRRPVGRRQP